METHHSRERVHTVWISIGLFLVTLAVFWQVADFDFNMWDDEKYISQNPHVQHGLTLEGLLWAFRETLMGNWHPITWLSHMLDCTCFGLNPGAHHVVNVLIHAINAVLLFFVLMRMTSVLLPSAIVAALFAWHPIHVESVAWLAERKDVLSTFFGLLALLAYSQYVNLKRTKASRQRFWFSLTLLAFALSLMSKAMWMTFPFLLLLLDFWPLQRISPGLRETGSKAKQWAALILEKVPFICLAAVMSFVTFFAQSRHRAVDMVEGLSFWDRVGNAIISYVRYLGKTFWPVDLSPLYPHPGHWPLWQIIGAAFVLLAITVFCFARLRQMPWQVVGWLWYLGTLVPVIGIVQIGWQSMADRYTYFPLVGIFIAVVWTCSRMLESRPAWRIPARFAAVVICLLCLGTTFAQTRHWRNSVTLFNRAIAVTKNNSIAHYNLGHALGARGDRSGMTRHYREALRIDPDYFSARVNLASILIEEGAFQEATNHLAEAVRMYEAQLTAQRLYAIALAGAGDLPAAAEHFARAAELDPENPVIYLEWGKTLMLLRLPAMAERRFRDTIALEPGSAEANAQLAMALAEQGKTLEAIGDYAASLELEPNSAQVLNNLAWLLAAHPDANQRNGAEAVVLARRACELTQFQQPLVIGTLAAAYAENGEFEQACETARKAIAVAEAAGQPEVAERNRELLRRYEAGKPVSDTR